MDYTGSSVTFHVAFILHLACDSIILYLPLSVASVGFSGRFFSCNQMRVSIVLSQDSVIEMHCQAVHPKPFSCALSSEKLGPLLTSHGIKR